MTALERCRIVGEVLSLLHEKANDANDALGVLRAAMSVLAPHNSSFEYDPQEGPR